MIKNNFVKKFFKKIFTKNRRIDCVIYFYDENEHLKGQTLLINITDDEKKLISIALEKIKENRDYHFFAIEKINKKDYK